MARLQPYVATTRTLSRTLIITLTTSDYLTTNHYRLADERLTNHLLSTAHLLAVEAALDLPRTDQAFTKYYPRTFSPSKLLLTSLPAP